MFKFGIIIKSFEAFKRIKPILLLLVTSIVTGAIFDGTSSISVHFAYRSPALSGITFFIGVLIATIIGLIGYTAAGKMLMEYARNKSSIPITDAILFSLFSFYRFIISGIILFVIPFVVAIIALIYFFIAKIPDLGKLLDFIGLPVFTIIFSLIFLAIALVGFMIAPMVFEGNGIKEIFVKSFKIYKKHATLLFGYFIFIYIVLFIVAAVFVILSICSLGLTSAILMITKPTYLYSNMYGGFGNMMMGALGGGLLSYLAMYGKFIGFGVSIVFMLIISLMEVYMMLGQSYIYLDITKDMDFTDADAQFNDVALKVKNNIDKYKEKASSMSNKMPVQDNTVNSNFEPKDNASENTKFCTKCGAKNKPGSNFCENCGSQI
jgi:ribosomal protein L40E